MKNARTIRAICALAITAFAFGAQATPPPGPVGSVGLYYTMTSDPTTGSGYAAPLWQIGYRTDVSPTQFCFKFGNANTAWACTGSGGGGSGTISGSGTANITTKWTGPSTIGNGWAHDDGSAWGSASIFTIDEVSGNTLIGGSLTATAAQSELGNLNIGILSPSSITGTVNNYSPTGWSNKATTVIEVQLSAAATLTGLQALNPGSTVSLCNMSPTFDLTINDESGLSTAANRIENAGGFIKLAHHNANPEPECANYVYDGTITRWMNTSTTASTLHVLTLTSGFTVQSSGAAIAGGLQATQASAFAASVADVTATMAGSTFDTTAGPLQGTSINCTANATRLAGANNLTNVCGQFTASGGQINDAIVTLAGNNIFNESSGTSTFDGNLLMGAAGAVIELIQASGASSTPKITAFAGNPNGTVSGTSGDFLIDTSTPAIWQSTGGTAWTEGGGSGVTGGGTAPDMTIWTGANSVGNYAGSASTVCTVGQFVTTASLSGSGALTATCAAAAGGGTLTGVGTAPDLMEWTGTTVAGNYAGSAATACSAGSAATSATLSGSGALTTTCSAFTTGVTGAGMTTSSGAVAFKFAGTAPIFGLGKDGACAFDGVTTPVAGATLSGSTYTLTRPVWCSGGTIATGVTVKLAGYPYMDNGTGTLSGTAHILADGNSAITSSPGGATAGSWFSGTLAGGAVGAIGNSSTAALCNPWLTTISGGTAGSIGGTGGTGGTGAGGGGGGASATNVGFAGGGVTAGPRLPAET